MGFMWGGVAGFVCNAAHYTLNQAFAFSFGSGLHCHFTNQTVAIFGISLHLI